MARNPEPNARHSHTSAADAVGVAGAPLERAHLAVLHLAARDPLVAGAADQAGDEPVEAGRAVQAAVVELLAAAGGEVLAVHLAQAARAHADDAGHGRLAPAALAARVG